MVDVSCGPWAGLRLRSGLLTVPTLFMITDDDWLIMGSFPVFDDDGDCRAWLALWVLGL